MKNLFLILTIVASVVYSQTKISIAVNDLEARGMSKDDAGIISDRLREELLNTGTFRVMERTVMDQILKEQAFQSSGACSGSECQVQMGRLLGVDRLLIGSIGKLGSLYTLNVRMLNVETGEVEQSISQDHQGAIEDLVRGPIRAVAAKLAWAVTSKNTPKAASNDWSDVQAAPAPQPAPTPAATPAPKPAPATKPAPPPTAAAPSSSSVIPSSSSSSAPSIIEVGIRLHFGSSIMKGDSFSTQVLEKNDGNFQIGAELRINLGTIFLKPELLFTGKKFVGGLSNDLGSGNSNEFDYETELTYITGSGLVGVHVGNHLEIFTGPTLEFLNKSEMKIHQVTTINDNVDTDTTYTDKDIDGFEKMIPSLTTGIGGRFGDFVIDFRYQIPFIDAFKVSSVSATADENQSQHLKISNWYLGLGYLF